MTVIKRKDKIFYKNEGRFAGKKSKMSFISRIFALQNYVLCGEEMSSSRP